MIGTVVPSVGVVGRGTTLVLIDDGRKIVAAREHAKRITFCKRGCGGRWGGRERSPVHTEIGRREWNLIRAVARSSKKEMDN